MASVKYELEKFSGANDYTLWSKKVTTILTTWKALKVLDDPKNLPITLTIEEKQNMEEIPYTTLILNISNIVLGQVIDETILMVSRES